MIARIFRAILCLLLAASSACGAEYVYVGPWKTTNRPLDGQMTCVVTSTGKHQWQGHFFGVWQGVDFDYTVDFTGPPKNLRGTATIDGAGYLWSAWISPEQFRANFNGDRYEGSFELRRATPDQVAAAKKARETR